MIRRPPRATRPAASCPAAEVRSPRSGMATSRCRRTASTTSRLRRTPVRASRRRSAGPPPPAPRPGPRGRTRTPPPPRPPPPVPQRPPKPRAGPASPGSIVGPSRPETGRGWLPFLAAQGNPAPATAASLGGVLTALLDFSRIKRALSPGDERLLAVLQQPAAMLPGNPSALLSLTGWAQLSLNALLTHLFGSADPASLSSVENFSRVYDAYSIVRTAGLSASALISAITNAPTATTVSALQSALRARHAEADWLTVVRPISDAARILQRDALVAYIVQKLGDGYAQSTIGLTPSAAAATG